VNKALKLHIAGTGQKAAYIGLMRDVRKEEEKRERH
jgi:hypothetical protein